MNALSGTERSRLSRARKRADEFSKNYLEGSHLVSAEDFIQAKQCEFECNNNVASVQFNQEVINEFYEWLKQHDADHDNGEELYSVFSLIEAWDLAWR